MVNSTCTLLMALFSASLLVLVPSKRDSLELPLIGEWLMLLQSHGGLLSQVVLIDRSDCTDS